jgi:hypothetical protein
MTEYVVAAAILVGLAAWVARMGHQIYILDREQRQRRRLAEEGRRLASQREDLIAQGVDPAELEIPLHPGP